MAQTLIDPAVETLQQRLLQLGPDATPEQLAYLGKAVESIGGRSTVLDVMNTGHDQINLIKQEGQRQVAAVQNVAGLHLVAKQDTLPFIFGVVSRYGDSGFGYGAFTTELGQFYNGQGLNKLRLITGYHDWSIDYRAFSTPPSLQFLTGSNGQFIYRDHSVRHERGRTEEYKYPRAVLGVLFVRNTTDQHITRDIWFGGACYWESGYEGMGVGVLTPNGTNANPAAITSLSESNRWSYAASTPGDGADISIVVPANTTVAVLFYTSPYPYVHLAQSGYRSFFEHFVLANMRAFLSDGLEVDLERTIKAFTNPDGSGDPVDIWH